MFSELRLRASRRRSCSSGCSAARRRRRGRRDPAAARSTRCPSERRDRGGRVRRRLLLGRPGRLSARRRRAQGRVGLRGRREGDRELRDRRQRRHGPRRDGADHLRPGARSPTASCCRSISRWRTIRRSSTGRGPIAARSTARRSFRRARSSARSPSSTSRSSIAAKVFRKKIVTTLEDGRTFYPAEAYHQDFLVRNPTLSVHRDQRPPEGTQPRAGVPRDLPHRARARDAALCGRASRRLDRRHGARGLHQVDDRRRHRRLH